MENVFWTIKGWNFLTHCVWPSVAVWQHRCRSTLAHIIASCLTTPSHYLNQSLLLISGVLRHSPENNFAVCSQAANLYNEFENQTFEIIATSSRGQWVNTLRPRQNGRDFADDNFKGIFLNENVLVPIKFSLKFVPKGPINNIPALVQIMGWHRPGNKPLSELMMVRLLTHIYVTRSQWVKRLATIPSHHSSCWYHPWVLTEEIDGHTIFKWAMVIWTKWSNACIFCTTAETGCGKSELSGQQFKRIDSAQMTCNFWSGATHYIRSKYNKFLCQI